MSDTRAALVVFIMFQIALSYVSARGLFELAATASPIITAMGFIILYNKIEERKQ